MVQYCVAYGCKEASRKGTSLSFHSFPSDEGMKMKWILSLRRLNFQPSKHSRLCSKHFTPDCFDLEAFGKGRKLKKGSVPTLFDIPQHMNKQERKRKAPKERSATSFKLFETDSPMQTGSAKKPRVAYVGDICDDLPVSPRKAKKCVGIAKQSILQYRKKLKLARQQCRRSMVKNKNLTDLLKHLQDKQMINEAASHTLEKSLPPFLQDVILRAKRGTNKQQFSPELRTFALTLNFYSAKAYDYVRKMFLKTLPHPSTIHKWYSSVDGKPGFSTEACSALKTKCLENRARSKETVCALMLDEMAIRKHIEFDGNRFVGYTDFGTGLDDDSLPEAKEALVFMLVALNSNWKIPIAYFLIDGLDGAERANLVIQCLHVINEFDVIISTLTFDGAASNISMAGHLGAKLTLPNLKSWFLSPITGEKIYIFLDPCHMLKLVRNCLASKGSLASGKDLVQWKYLVELETLQSTEGLKAATKLGQRHINWSREKMKVKLAAQTLSNSVADALRFCEQDLKLQDFRGSEATSYFIEIFNHLFDIFNSRNLLAKGYKAPLKDNTVGHSIEFLHQAKTYILSLRETINGIPLCHSNRKTGFVGFIVCIDSVIGLYDDIVVQKKLLDFLLTYKLSQDHLEIFFSAIRSRGGHNNNPTARQFEAAFKRLIVHIQIGATSNANCLAVDSTSILNVSSTYGRVDFDSSSSSSSDAQPASHVEHDHDYFAVPNRDVVNSYVDNVIVYISGFVVRAVTKIVKCINCLEALYSNETCSDLLRRKNRGGLICPSIDVVKICRMVEVQCRISGISSRNCNLSDKTKGKIVNAVMMQIESTIFQKLDDHILNQEPIDNHKIQLIKTIASKYAEVRLYHAGKTKTDALHDTRVRSIYTKLVLFQNQ